MRFANVENFSALKNISFIKLNSKISNISNNDIIFLQNKFLLPGFHIIESDKNENHTKFIDQILTSLNYYQNVAFLTAQQNFINEKYFNLYKYFEDNYNIDQELFNFFFDQFNFDFLGIEISNKLLCQGWYYPFEKLLLEFQIDTYIPIVILI